MRTRGRARALGVISRRSDGPAACRCAHTPEDEVALRSQTPEARRDLNENGRLTRRLVQVRHGASAAAAAAQVLAQLNCRAVFAEALNEIGGVKHALVFAPPTDCDERHSLIDKLAECATDPALPWIEIAVRIIAYRLDPGHFGRTFGSMSSPPKHSRKRSACSRSVKQKTFMSVPSR
jgi:hypothetical protein